MQVCDWLSNPAILGSYVYTLPVGEIIRGTFPSPCAPGLLGSADIQFQGSQDCAGPCPAGYYCPTEATVNPTICDRGSYCPNGTVTPLPWCVPLAFSIAVNLPAC